MGKRFFSSESVTEGHPHNSCDQISDGVLHSILAKDPMARVACETAVTTGLVLVIGEISTNCYVDIQKIARQTIKDIGYDRAKYGFDGDTCAVLTALDEQSPDIAMGVDRALEAKEGSLTDEQLAIGAGDQGMMFGFACDETPELMPMPIALAHRLTREVDPAAAVRKDGTLPYLRPDGKSMVSIEYAMQLAGPRRTRPVISSQHGEDVELGRLQEDIIRDVIKATISEELLDAKTRYLINPTGRFVVGGPQGDSGLTGRKIIVDTYGGYASHGGGAFSGKI